MALAILSALVRRGPFLHPATRAYHLGRSSRLCRLPALFCVTKELAMYIVVNAIGSEISRHRVLSAAGRVALARLDCRVRDGEGRDCTGAAKDAANYPK